VINPGVAFYIANGNGVAITNTFVGTVHFDSGSYPGTTTNAIAANAALSLLASKLPIGGGITSVLGFTNVVTAGAGALDGDPIYIPVIKANGNPGGFITVIFDSTLSSGFGDPTDSFSTNEPVIPVGTGFFFGNGNAAPINWVQSLGQ
jgi:hypothetical protein